MSSIFELISTDLLVKIFSEMLVITDLFLLDEATKGTHFQHILLHCMRHDGFSIELWEYYKISDIHLIPWMRARKLKPTTWYMDLGCPEDIQFDKVHSLYFNINDYIEYLTIMDVVDVVEKCINLVSIHNVRFPFASMFKACRNHKQLKKVSIRFDIGFMLIPKAISCLVGLVQCEVLVLMIENHRNDFVENLFIYNAFKCFQTTLLMDSCKSFEPETIVFKVKNKTTLDVVANHVAGSTSPVGLLMTMFGRYRTVDLMCFHFPAIKELLTSFQGGGLKLRLPAYSSTLIELVEQKLTAKCQDQTVYCTAHVILKKR